MVARWAEKAVSANFHEDRLRCKILVLYRKGLERTERLAYEELEKLLDDEKKQPITYNHD